MRMEFKKSRQRERASVYIRRATFVGLVLALLMVYPSVFSISTADSRTHESSQLNQIVPNSLIGEEIDLVRFGYSHWSATSGDRDDPDGDLNDVDDSFGGHIGIAQYAVSYYNHFILSRPTHFIQWEFRAPEAGDYVLTFSVATSGTTRAILSYHVGNRWIALPEISSSLDWEDKIVSYLINIPEGQSRITVVLRFSGSQGAWFYAYGAVLSQPREETTIPPVASHPVLFFNKSDIPQLRSLASTTHKAIWDVIKGYVDHHIEDQPVVKPSPITYIRHYESIIEAFALAYVLSGDEKYAEAAKNWILTVCSYPSWENTAVGLLASAEMLIGVSIGYDWIYDYLGNAERKVIEDKLRIEATEKYYLADFGHWWAVSYWHNISWLKYAALGITGLTLQEAHGFARKWTDLASSYYRTQLSILPSDGSYHEGIGYWSFALHQMLQYLEALRHITGESLYDNAWLRNTAYYRLYASLPNMKNVLCFGDCSDRDWVGPSVYLHRLAAEYNNPYAQWGAESLSRELGEPFGWHNWGEQGEILQDQSYAYNGISSLRVRDTYAASSFVEVNDQERYRLTVHTKAEESLSAQIAIFEFGDKGTEVGLIWLGRFTVATNWVEQQYTIDLDPFTTRIVIGLFPCRAQCKQGTVWFDDISFTALESPINLVTNPSIEISSDSYTFYQNAIWNFLWYDPTVEKRSPHDLSTHKYFDDLELVILRSGWDEDDNLLAFKSGPPGGHLATQIAEQDPSKELNAGHNHPDQNSFVFYANHEGLITDPGYTMQKWTKNHNTVLVNGVGQLGEGTTWYLNSGSLPHSKTAFIRDFTVASDHVHVLGDATPVYPNELGLTKFWRHLVYLTDYFVIFDELDSDSSANYDWYLHTEGDIALEENVISIAKDESMLRVHLLEPTIFSSEIAPTIVLTEGGEAEKGKHIRVSISAATTRYLAVFYPYITDQDLPRITKLEVDNLIGTRVEKGNDLDLILFSRDGNPVDGYIELSGEYETRDGGYVGTTLQVQFQDYKVIRLKKVESP